MKRIVAPVILASLLAVSAAYAAEPATITQAELVQRTQQLYDAVAPGDKGPWKLYLADDVMVFDEKGRDMDKKAMLVDLDPMPAGYSGSIKVANAKTLFAPGVAILSYDCNEIETVFGRELHARYHQTDTWLYRNQVWQIASSQVLRYYEDPATGEVSKALLNDYVGTYEMAPGHTMTVTRQGDDLYAQSGSGKPVKLLPESTDMFFRPGVEGRRLFHRDASGHVDLLIDRRNNEDLLWKRVS
jgi:Domain of unknown function (DUF3471)/Domain of unknown function (DUF4440)